MPSEPVKVSIMYCAECGYEPQTIALAEALMKRFMHELSSIEIVPGLEGSFEVKVGNELVHSMYREGGFPEHLDIIKAVEAKLAGSAGG
jgi:selenoprotein W-related protein